MQGKIIKGIAGFYYVFVDGEGVFECKAKGVFRNRNIKPLVGDNVIIEILDNDKFLGNITDVLPRKNELIRPACANVDQAVIIFAITKPQPNLNLLSRFLVEMAVQDIDTVICFNKLDLATDEDVDSLREQFKNAGCRVVFTSTYERKGQEELYKLLHGKTTVLAGPSGVGKSSVTNLMMDDEAMETGDISEKIGRGKHTTRHAQLFTVDGETFLMDTPGFTSLYNTVEANDLRFYFNEFSEHEGKCRFNGCVHVNEPDCSVKAALEAGEISRVRYDSYIEIYNELKSKKKF